MKAKNKKRGFARVLVYLQTDYISYNGTQFTEIVRIVMHDAKSQRVDYFNHGIIMN